MITIISKGTIMSEIQNEKIRSLPGNFNLEKAKAAKIVTNMVSATTAAVTMIEFRKYLAKGAV